jgi:hypothetical protein
MNRGIARGRRDKLAKKQPFKWTESGFCETGYLLQAFQIFASNYLTLFPYAFRMERLKRPQR